MIKNILARTLILTFLAILSVSAQGQPTCEVDQQNLRAEYSIAARHVNGHEKLTTLVLWRLEQQVAHQYPKTQITELWQHVRKQKIKPFRMFDEHKRTIEYQPGESVHGKTERDWSHRYQLIADHVIEQMDVTEVLAGSCHSKQIRVGNFGELKMRLVWLPELKLIESLTWQSPQGEESWQLVDMASNASEIEDFFAQRHAYYATDFADIGDDHTDPFLTQMTNLGFIEHGANGFYQASQTGITATSSSAHGHKH